MWSPNIYVKICCRLSETNARTRTLLIFNFFGNYVQSNLLARVFQVLIDLIQNDLWCDGDLATETIKCAEVFICELYKVSVESIDKARFLLFAKMGTPEKLSPISDAFKYHVIRSHSQTMVWRQAINPIQSLPKPEDMGWRIDGDQLVPFLMSLDSIHSSSLSWNDPLPVSYWMCNSTLQM